MIESVKNLNRKNNRTYYSANSIELRI